MSALRIAMDARYLTAATLRGMDRYLVGLASELVRRGVEVTLMYRQRQPIHEAHISAIGCRAEGLADWSAVHWEQVAVPRALRRGEFDLWHAPAERGIPFFAPCLRVMTYHSATQASYADLIARGMLPGRLTDYLGLDTRGPRGWRHAYYAAQARHADHVLTVSEFSREEIVRLLGLPPKRVSATLLAVGDDFRSPPRRAHERDLTLSRLGVSSPFLLYVGGYEPHKNVTGLLEMFAAVRQRRPDVSLVLVGTGDVPDALRDRARSLGLRDETDVCYLANLSCELVDLYDACELFVSLSWRESFGLPALEAMSRGASVVASAWGATPEVLGECGRMVDPRDPHAVAAVVLELLEQSPAARSAAAECARRRAEQFTWDETGRRTLEVYDRLLQRRAAR